MTSLPTRPQVAALLPALDPTPMGWQARAWYLGPHAPPLFDRTGNIGPTVWWAGRVVGGWAQRASGEVVYRLLEDIGADGEAAVAAQAAALESWLGPARVTPSLPHSARARTVGLDEPLADSMPRELSTRTASRRSRGGQRSCPGGAGGGVRYLDAEGV